MCKSVHPRLFRDDLLLFRGEWNLFADYFVSLQRKFNEILMRRELKQRLSESRAKRVWALPNRWSSESHQACLNGRVVTEVGEANVSCFDRRSNITNGAKIMAELFAFGEFWRRLSHLGKFNTCQWHSACTKFGHSKDLITLSLSLRYSPTVAHTLLRFADTRASIYGFSWSQPREAALFFVPHAAEGKLQ